jgi:asparagine synthase (glutamine-hydrolysing)
MCGFGGIINSKTAIDTGHLKNIASSVSFRGPDSCGLRVLNEQLQKADRGRSAMFFNRLAIIDLDSRSDQPFEDDQHLLMFNGEIYNYTELKSLLQKKSVVFHTTSDTEVLFHALRIWGEAALSKLNGMFAFFWLNKQTKEFILGRDRVGIKPVYYSQQNGALLFASELHSILRLAQNGSSISTDAVKMYLWLQFIPTPYSIVDNIYKLPPGNFLSGTIDDLEGNKVLHPSAYWNAYSEAAAKHTSKKEDLEYILKSSLERQLQADVPIGLFLSSGVDSSLLAALVNKYFVNGKDVNFFTVAFDEDTSSDESTEARAFISGFENPHLINHLLQIDSSFVKNRLGDLYRFFDEPFSDSASLLNWVISEKAREHVTVAISGDGADELFWGYPRYDRYELFTKRNRFPVLSNAGRAMAGLLPASGLKHQVLYGIQADPLQRHFDQFLSMGMRFMIKDSILKYPMWSLKDAELILDRDDIPGILDIRTYLADAMLYKVDRASMASSLEVRVPYLDNEVIDYALHLPFKYKSNDHFKNKAILKELLLKLAPHYNVHKKKKGFSFPLRKWLMTHWKEEVLGKVTKDSLMKLGLEGKTYLDIVHRFYEHGEPHYEHDVWALYNLVLWYEQYSVIAK